MDKDRIDYYIKKFLPKSIPALYETELIFYFFSLLYLHVQNVQNIKIKLNRSQIYKLMKSYNNGPSMTIKKYLINYEYIYEQDHLSDAFKLYELMNEKHLLSSRENIAYTALSYLYAVTEQSASLGENVIPQDITWIFNLLMNQENKNIEMSICDPFCRTGSLLASVLFNNRPNYNVFGFEKNKKIADICEFLLYFSEIESFKLETIKSFDKDDRTFDFIVSQIPFGNRHESFDLQYMFKKLNKNGTLISIIPNGVLFRMGKDAELRESWIKNNHLDTVISLPENMLYNTTIPVSIIVLKKIRDSKTVQFINCAHSKEEIIISRKRNILGDEAKQKIIDALNSKEDIDNYSRFVPLNELEENDYILNIERYITSHISKQESSKPFDYLKRIEQLQMDIFNTQQKLKKFYY